MAVAVPRVRHWTREDYQKMAEAGVFAPGERVELIEGEIVEMTPQNRPHAVAVAVADEVLRPVFGASFHVRPQLPLALGPDSELEPDVAVVRGVAREYLGDHPTTAVLVLEISDTTLDFDRGRKGPLYSRARIPEYWILNLVDRVLEVYRDPGEVPGRPFQYHYGSVRRFGPHESVSPLAAPGRQIRVADLLP